MIDLTSSPIRTIPFELWSMVDAIYKKGLMEPNLWKEQSTDEELIQVRERIDKRESLDEIEYESFLRND